LGQYDQKHIRSIEPAVTFEHPNAIRRHSEDCDHDHLFRFSGLSAMTLAAVLSMTAGRAIAADNNVSADQILEALQPKPLTRGLSVAPQVDPSVKAREISLVDG
jgi:Na+(H+)/acetate symporter ActP